MFHSTAPLSVLISKRLHRRWLRGFIKYFCNNHCEIDDPKIVFHVTALFVILSDTHDTSELQKSIIWHDRDYRHDAFNKFYVGDEKQVLAVEKLVEQLKRQHAKPLVKVEYSYYLSADELELLK